MVFDLLSDMLKLKDVLLSHSLSVVDEVSDQVLVSPQGIVGVLDFNRI